MKSPLSTCTGEDGRGHVCVIKLFLWLNTQKLAERPGYLCGSVWGQQHKVSRQNSSLSRIVPSFTSEFTCPWTNLSHGSTCLLENLLGQVLSESFSFFSLPPSHLLDRDVSSGHLSLFLSSLGSVDIPLSMTKTTPNSLSRSLRQNMSLTLRTGMTSLSLVSSCCSLNCSNHACLWAHCMHPPQEWKCTLHHVQSSFQLRTAENVHFFWLK